jgi:hypothetical protein
MSNYPAGAEHDSNAPFNKEENFEITTKKVNLFDFLIEQDLPYDCVDELKRFNTYLKQSQHILKDLAINENNTHIQDKLFLVKRLLTQPQIFIENE